jgi:hypothetical protein
MEKKLYGYEIQVNYSNHPFYMTGSRPITLEIYGRGEPEIIENLFQAEKIFNDINDQVLIYNAFKGCGDVEVLLIEITFEEEDGDYDYNTVLKKLFKFNPTPETKA